MMVLASSILPALDHPLRLPAREPAGFDALVVHRRSLAGDQVGGQVDGHALSHVAGADEERRQLVPASRAVAGLFDQLAPGGLRAASRRDRACRPATPTYTCRPAGGIGAPAGCASGRRRPSSPPSRRWRTTERLISKPVLGSTAWSSVTRNRLHAYTSREEVIFMILSLERGGELRPPAACSECRCGPSQPRRAVSTP